MAHSNRSEDISKGKTKNHYCTNCGKLLKPNWNNCPYCSVKIRKELWKDKVEIEDEIIYREQNAEILSDQTASKREEKIVIHKPQINLCPFCGYENEASKRYCYQCGYIFKNH